jgi:hypothetical protein
MDDGMVDGSWRVEAVNGANALAEATGFSNGNGRLSGASHPPGIVFRLYSFVDYEVEFSGVVDGDAVAGTWKTYTDAGVSATGTFRGLKLGKW